MAGMCSELTALFGDGADSFMNLTEVVFRQVPGIGPWVGEHFVFFIQCLGDLESTLGREPVA